MTAPGLVYVYGVGDAERKPQGAPAAIDDAPLRFVRGDALAALVSDLDATRYAPEALERDVANIDWVAPRAVAHDRVLTWASDGGAVVPFPMWTIFSSDAAVVAMLDARREALACALARAASGREYVLRIYRLDDELAPHAAALSPRLATLARDAAAATPGQRYLISRKVEQERQTEHRAIGRRVAADAFERLRPFAVAATTSPLRSRSADGEPPLVLDAAFLVAQARYTDFQRAIGAIVEEHEGRGFRVAFTGPWPPYHFVDDAQARSDGE